MLGVAAENWAEPCKGPVDCSVITCVQFDLLGGTGRAFRLTLLEVNGNGEEMERMRRFRAYVVTFICVVFGLPCVTFIECESWAHDV